MRRSFHPHSYDVSKTQSLRHRTGCPEIVLGQAPRPKGSIVAPFGGSFLESYKVTPKTNYYGAYGYRLRALKGLQGIALQVLRAS